MDLCGVGRQLAESLARSVICGGRWWSVNKVSIRGPSLPPNRGSCSTYTAKGIVHQCRTECMSADLASSIADFDAASTQHVHPCTAYGRSLDDAAVVIPETQCIRRTLHDAGATLDAPVGFRDLHFLLAFVHVEHITRAHLYALGHSCAAVGHQFDVRFVVEGVDVASVPGRDSGKVDRNNRDTSKRRNTHSRQVCRCRRTQREQQSQPTTAAPTAKTAKVTKRRRP